MELSGLPLIFIVCLSGLFGNFLVLIVGIVKKKYQNNATNCYIMSLALSDFLFLLISVPFTTYLAVKTNWSFGETTCKFYIYLAHVLLQVTCYTLAAMSIDRYLYMVHETTFRSYRKPKNIRIVCISIWISSILLLFPYELLPRLFLENKQNTTVSNVDCTVNKDGPFYSSCLFTFTVYYVLPLLIIGLSYFRIYLHVRRTEYSIVKHLSGPLRQSVIIRNRRVQRILLGLTLAFALCWIPIHILEILNCSNLVSRTFYDAHQEKLDLARLIAHSLSYFNSCLNPFLYASLNRSYFSS